jgi:hypothetical protein
MTDEQKKKIERRILILSIVDIAVLAVLLVLIGVAGLVETWIFPTVVSVFLALFWVTSDVLPIKWLNGFEGKTDDQRKSYYVYAVMDLIGFGGLVYFIVDMNSMTGAIVYVCMMVLKKKFREDYNGPEKEEAAEEEAAEENASEAQEMEAASETAENTSEQSEASSGAPAEE